MYLLLNDYQENYFGLAPIIFSFRVCLGFYNTPVVLYSLDE